MPDDLAPVRRLLAHLLATDPDRFWVAVRDGRPGDPAAGLRGDGPAHDALVGFSSASVRERIWFLAMLFVDPDRQAAGVGSALLDRSQAGRDVDPGGPRIPSPDDPLDTGLRTWGACADTLQPIANALYARRGMPPRVPIWRLFGEVRRWSALPEPKRALEAVPFEALRTNGDDGARRLAGTLDDLDRELIGAAHHEDHEYLRREGRIGWLVRERRGGRVLGYAYGSGAGRVGPVAAVDPALHPALLGLAARETHVLGPVAAWVPGSADLAMRTLLDAGLRLDGFPGLVCWSRADHPFGRYLPISLAIV
jgi:GNAT superfamily N-acetyltransferase